MATLYRSQQQPSRVLKTWFSAPFPELPKVHVHNPVIAYENGDEFLKYWYMAAEGKLDPFVLVVEGSIPNEKIKKEGYWAALGTDPHTKAADHDV